MSSCANICAISVFDRIGIVCPGGSFTGASVILLRCGAAWSAKSLRNASATRSRSVEPRFTAVILARFTSSSGRSNVVRIKMPICFHAWRILPCGQLPVKDLVATCSCFYSFKAASRSHGRGHWFDPSTAHHLEQKLPALLSSYFARIWDSGPRQSAPAAISLGYLAKLAVRSSSVIMAFCAISKHMALYAI